MKVIVCVVLQSDLFSLSNIQSLHPKLDIPQLVWNGKTEELEQVIRAAGVVVAVVLVIEAALVILSNFIE